MRLRSCLEEIDWYVRRTTGENAKLLSFSITSKNEKQSSVNLIVPPTTPPSTYPLLTTRPRPGSSRPWLGLFPCHGLVPSESSLGRWQRGSLGFVIGKREWETRGHRVRDRTPSEKTNDLNYRSHKRRYTSTLISTPGHVCEAVLRRDNITGFLGNIVNVVGSVTRNMILSKKSVKR